MASKPTAERPPVEFAFAGTLNHFRPHLPLALVSTEAARRLFDLGAQIPAAMASWAHVECRLDSRDQTDLIIQIEPAGRATLTNTSHSWARDARGRPEWRGVLRLATAWQRKAAASVIGRLWLEFDLPPGTDGPQCPSVFIELHPRAQRASPEFQIHNGLAQLGLLAAPAPSAGARRAIARCLEALPNGAALFALGAMTSRAGAPIRLCLTGLSDDAIGPYLRAIGWPGDWAAFGEAFREAASAVGGAASHAGILHLDVEHDLAARIGVEIMLERRSQVRGTLKENALLELLVQWDSCTPAKADGLRSWPGVSCHTMPHELWPSLALRRVNHVKLVYEPGQRVEAKAYLCLAHDHELLPKEARL